MSAASRPAGSLWEATAAAARPTPPLEGDIKADVCVVGGGFTGLSAALRLAEAGVSVVVLESDEPGSGASGRNGGQVLPGLKWDPDDLVRRFGPDRGERLVSFVGGTPEFVYDLIEKHGIDCGLRRECGWLNAAADEGAFAAQARRVDQWRRRGAPIELIDREATASLLGSLRYRGAMLDHRAGALNPLSYARGLAAAAVCRGAVVHGGSEVTGLTRAGGSWRVTTGRGTVTATDVLLGTNGYTDGLWPGLAREIVPLHSLQVATKPLSDNVRRSILPYGHVVSDTQRLLLYFRQDDDGRLVMGGRGSFGASNRSGLFRFVEAAARRLFPQLGEPDWEHRWGGKVALTSDHLPRVHEMAPGVRACLGYNGRGVAMATAIGKALADWTLTGDEAAVPLPVTPLRPIPFHGLRRPALELMAAYARLRDRLG